MYLRGEPLTVVAPGTQKRAFTYVRDLARGIILVGAGGSGDGYALGATESYSVLEIASAFGGPCTLVDGYPGRSHSLLDVTKAQVELGWKATVDVLDYINSFVHQHPHPGTDT